ncbi:MAG: putative bifunctional diguanylate cyclase/phosphodiesterase, partial [Acidimicrobiia bacterium]
HKQGRAPRRRRPSYPSRAPWLLAAGVVALLLGVVTVVWARGGKLPAALILGVLTIVLTGLVLRAERRLAHLAALDPLTGLPNRDRFMGGVAEALARASQTEARLAVLFLDLDHFKVVNDGLGHPAGDRLLNEIGRRLLGLTSRRGTVARFGGDEFMVLYEDVGDEAAARELATRLTAAVRLPIALSEHEGEVFVTASIGIALSNGNDTADSLMRDAGAAMYRAKEQGRARLEVFDPQNHERAVDHLRTANALHRALERREFEVHFQPVIDLEAGGVTGFEALLRWRHPERGLVAPGEFIGRAESTGLIVPIGAWVLAEACQQAARWQASHADRPPLTISVNLSPRQLAEPSLPAEVARTMAETGVHPDSVWLEITETTLMHDAESAIGTLEALQEQGVHIAVDDFGTGYSSLSYLKRFPVEALKVDRTFVDGLGRDPEDTVIATACVSLAHALGLTAIAEGVESPTQVAELRTLGCELAQGFLFAAPASAPDLGDRPVDNLGNWAGLTADG